MSKGKLCCDNVVVFCAIFMQGIIRSGDYVAQLFLRARGSIIMELFPSCSFFGGEGNYKAGLAISLLMNGSREIQTRDL